jgi:general secretion pathway protein I
MIRFRRNGARSGSAGFTLIEVLVALAVVAATITAIGALVAASTRGAMSIDQRLQFRETLRALVTSLPDRRDLDPGSATGVAAGFRWRLEIAPFVATFVDPQAPTPWQPEAVVITVRSPSGQQLQINTVRLRRRPG